MSNIVLNEKRKADEPQTEAARFLARRGVLMMKEFREIGTIRCEYGKKIAIKTLVITSAVMTTGNISHSIAFDLIDEDGRESDSAFLDFDETEEFINAFDFITTRAKQMSAEVRDYTEVIYISKDGITFGYYQSEGVQQPFVRLGSYSDTTFLSFQWLQSMKQALEMAKSHLISRGAEI
ncbi:MAG TPA: hypothetical protein VGX48_16875 [Pyrinomonadaceae bacterium]|jgi:hypothetical protein|nr:hypothetical protein [Pyrinomonadaceae bacterium]